MSNSIENDSRQEDLQQEGSQMNDSTKCPQCSGEMPANFPAGVCPACLLMQGMSPSTLHGAEGAESGSGHSGQRHSWTPPTPAELAPRFPQWEIVELLGQGGMGAVYKVRQKDLDRWAALKVLPSDVANAPNFAERFQREARTLAQLSHQHIVTVYEFGQCDGVFYLLMEFVDGVTLRQAIRAGTTSPSPVAATNTSPASPQSHSSFTATASPHQALAIVGQICDALQFAHEEGIVHRDIKPENILIDKRGRVKIADFGLAKLLGKQPHFPTLTGTHQIMGTPVYMAPEQMEGTKGVDHRADIFSLGVVFYELLTGELPLGRFAPPSQKYSLDVRLDEVVLRTLEKEPGRRYQQASEVKCDVESIGRSPRPSVESVDAMESELQNAIARKSHRISGYTALWHGFIAFWAMAFGFGLVLASFAVIDSWDSHPELVGKPGLLVMIVGFYFVLMAFCGFVAYHYGRSAWLVFQTVASLSQFTLEEAIKKRKADFRPQMDAVAKSQNGHERTPYWNERRVALLSIYAVGFLVGWFVIVPCMEALIHPANPADPSKMSIELEPADEPSDEFVAFTPPLPRRTPTLVPSPDQRAEAATRDPNEVNALVQFTAEGVKLHPNAFGTAELTVEQRVTVEKILTAIHGEYLKVEARYTKRESREDGTQVVLIEQFDNDFSKLEDALWSAIDSQFPVTQQQLLRERLPLLTTSRLPLPQVPSESMGPSSGGGMGGMPSLGPPAGASSPPGAFGYGNPYFAPRNLRYPQLLGWQELPLQISINRRGRWYRWKVGPQSDSFSDSGETPELPSGLRRFWREPGPSVPALPGIEFTSKTPKQLSDSPSAVFARAHEAYSARDWEQYADCFTTMGRDEWTFDQLTGMTAVVEHLQERLLTTESLEPHLAATLVHCERFLASVDTALPGLSLKMEERTTRFKSALDKEFDLQPPPAERRQERVKVIREVFGDQTRGIFILTSKSFRSINPDRPLLHHLKLASSVRSGNSDSDVTGTFGDENSKQQSLIRFKRINGEWKIDGLVDAIANTTLDFSMWVVASVTPNATSELSPSLTELLQQLDRLRAADKTPWDEVEKRANELLAKYTAPADKGRIHWMAAHVYGQSDIRGHGADVTRHAQEALKYERDPVQRGWLYMYLGCAAGLVEKREEATRWHLKNYLELLPFNLPDKAPELPTVGKFRGERFGPSDGEVDPDQVAVEVLQAAEVRARKEAELVRDLVKSRNVTIGLLQDLYGREYKADSDATVTLRKLATEVLRDEAIVLHLLQRVWPDAIPKS